jgi:flagellar basal-body rod protein FlgC
MFEAFDASASALRTERTRLNLVASNLANQHTTRNEFGEKVPFRRRLAVLMPGNPENANPKLGVQLLRIVKDDAAPRVEYNPAHPDALKFEDLYMVDDNGNVTEQRRPEYEYLDDHTWDRVSRMEGYVLLPNVDPVAEMKDAMMAARAYEANVAVIENSKSLINDSLSLIA